MPIDTLTFVLEGEVHWNDVALARRDSREIRGAEQINLRTWPQETDLIIVETAP
jgi:hypothetical protein